ncbi:MAG: YciI family protein [Pseudomonadota bacterium]
MKKYLCLANYKPADMAAMPPAEVQAMVSQCPAKDAELKATGHLRVSASLGEGVARLEPRGGKTQVIDGPFSEAKEIVGGFFIIEAADRDEAVRIASLHPAATLGDQAGWCIDIHAIDFFEQYNAEGKLPA